MLSWPVVVIATFGATLKDVCQRVASSLRAHGKRQWVAICYDEVAKPVFLEGVCTCACISVTR